MLSAIKNFFNTSSNQQETLELLALVAEKTDNAVIITDEKGAIIWSNEGFVKISGYSLEEVKGKKPGHFLQGPETNPITVSKIRENLNSGKPFQEEILNYHKNGNAYWIQLHITPVLNSQGKIEKFIAFELDITDQKSKNEKILSLMSEISSKNEEMLAAEEELRQNMEELEAIQEQLRSINFEQESQLTLINRSMNYVEFSIDGKILQVNEKFLQMMGYSNSEILGKPYSNLFSKNDNDLIEFNKLWGRILNGETIEGEFERITKSGEIKYLRSFYSPVKDVNNQVIKVIKFALDITESKNQSINLQKSNLLLNEKESKLRQLALVAAKTDNAVIITSPTGSIEWVNPGFTRLTGYALEDVVGQKPGHILQGPLTSQATVERIREHLKTKQSFREEIINYSKSGVPYWLSLSITPILDEFGEIEQFIAIESDITDEKNKNLELAEKSKEIQDSITYAGRIQKALLANQTDTQKFLSDFFILNRPKDFLSGDFAWFTESSGKLYIAVADCTGHGIPGAMMSVLGVTLLNQLIAEKPGFQPSELLKLLSASLQTALLSDQPQGKNVQDGMDIALICIDSLKDKVVFSGAHRNIFVVNNGIFSVLEGDKQFIGGSILESSQEFSDQEIKYEKGMRLYLFSDGVTDQFGGRENKKVTPKKFMFFLKTIQDLKIAKQKPEIDYFIDQWKGENEQTDDILVVGLEI